MSDVIETINLPEPDMESQVSVEESIKERRSVRSYKDDPVDLEKVSQLLWSAQGITDPENSFRSAPSAGATFPIEIYLVVPSNGVKELEEGLYHYQPSQHQLEKVLEEDLSMDLRDSAMGQDPTTEAATNIVIVANYDLTTSTYGERGIRYVHMEAGHIGENIHLQAEALDLGTVAIGAFSDEKVHDTLSLSKDLNPLYIFPIGYPEG